MTSRRSLLLGAGAALLAPRLAQAEALDDIRSRGELIVGMEAAYQPYEYFQDGKIVGYDVEIAERIARKLGVKLTLIDTAWNGIIPALYARKFDCIISGMVINRERAQRVLFSMPYSESGTVILKRANDNTLRVAEDLSGKIVGTQLGSANDPVAKAFEARLKAAGKPGFRDYKLYEHFPEAYLDLNNRRIDAVAVSRAVAKLLIRNTPGRYAIVEGLQNIRVYVGAAIRKEDPQLAAYITEVLGEMKADGSLAALQTKWFGETMETPNEVPAELP
ncbi:transporter substrate-binding domain-containing protein [Siccirubricoccus phaeus]|uniref:transporter substrate-binding domain-containing protein n=1 Tax=Siccirubricoccus phaeus TaxID=2595053 RepID=UPI0011F3879B|nr:transporter substrate-binding domain-containing protein [Siccirubricoccus phaeus]